MGPSSVHLPSTMYTPSPLAASATPSSLRHTQAILPPTRKALHIPGLPRFHPANYPTQDAAAAAAPSPSLAAIANAIPTITPLSRQPTSRHSSGAQKQLYIHQQQLVGIGRASLAATGTKSPRPLSPHLRPTGSPGPVTPLELEKRDEYFAAAAARGMLDETAKNSILEHHAQKEQQSRRSADVRRTQSGERMTAASR